MTVSAATVENWAQALESKVDAEFKGLQIVIQEIKDAIENTKDHTNSIESRLGTHETQVQMRIRIIEERINNFVEIPRFDQVIQAAQQLEAKVKQLEDSGMQGATGNSGKGGGKGQILESRSIGNMKEFSGDKKAIQGMGFETQELIVPV